MTASRRFRQPIVFSYVVKAALALGTALLLFIASNAQADRVDDGLFAPYEAALKGKRIGFIPVSMTIDMTRAWYAGLKQEADRVGYQIILRDPNWKVDVAAQAADEMLNEKPDLLILHADDQQAFNKVAAKAQAAGIPVILLNLKSARNLDVQIGPDWYEVGRHEALAMAQLCGTGSGKSGKVAIISGPSASAVSHTLLPGIEDGLAQRKDLTVVARQSGDWDANRARSVASTVLKQIPTLCGFIGLWEGEDIGIANAVRQAGMTGKVVVVTQGGGSRDAGCNQITAGNYNAYVKWDVRDQVRDLNDTIAFLLQTKHKAGTAPFVLYTPITTLTTSTMHPNSCWTTDEISAGG